MGKNYTPKNNYMNSPPPSGRDFYINLALRLAQPKYLYLPLFAADLSKNK